MFKAWRSPAFRVQALAVLVAAFAMTAMLILRDTVDQRFNRYSVKAVATVITYWWLPMMPRASSWRVA